LQQQPYPACLWQAVAVFFKLLVVFLSKCAVVCPLLKTHVKTRESEQCKAVLGMKNFFAARISTTETAAIIIALTETVLIRTPPHFFKSGRLIVLYVGEESSVLKALEAMLGPQFAGR
jgi:hypothetical protein